MRLKPSSLAETGSKVNGLEQWDYVGETASPSKVSTSGNSFVRGEGD